MKKYIILLIGMYFIPTIAMGYTPPGTWDPTGSHTETQHAEDYTCNQLKGMLGETYQAMYRLKGCANKVSKPVKHYQEQDLLPIKQQYHEQNSNSYWERKNAMKKKRWAIDMSNWVIDSWLAKYTNRQKLSGYLTYPMMNDIYQNGYMFRNQLNDCLGRKIYNDYSNISNMVNAKRYERLLHWIAGPLRDCHRQIRRPIP